MSRIALLVAAILAAWSAMPAQAEDVTVGGLKISAPWARATPKGASVGGGYMTITNTGTARDRLIGGSTDIARSFEVHEMTMDGGVMKMRAVTGGIEIKPGQTVTFDPRGYHIMLVGLKEQLKQGDHFKATLQFAEAGKVDVDFTIENVGATGAGSHDHTMPGMGGMHK
jgi:hypothetical protein